ncbi:IS66 family insertion sequence element accessory protein TnpB [Sulfitobacter sp. 1A13191]|uniref:IS66 family insertion sequence element accessory protein TnpB n=1 Tax=Sulfitobacter sp. 1A13191 TaxID=3368589 RepID=UPI0037451E2D
MIGPGTGVRVYVACGVTDMRKGIAGLAALTQDVLRQKPTGGAVFAFRGRRGDRLKLLYWDGQGFCLYYKVLERGRFPWPAMTEGAARLTSAQLAMLWEGIDCAGPIGAHRRPVWAKYISRNALFLWRHHVPRGRLVHVKSCCRSSRRPRCSEGDDCGIAGRECQNLGDIAGPRPTGSGPPPADRQIAEAGLRQVIGKD